MQAVLLWSSAWCSRVQEALRSRVLWTCAAAQALIMGRVQHMQHAAMHHFLLLLLQLSKARSRFAAGSRPL
jgi:hypothetical protein